MTASVDPEEVEESVEETPQEAKSPDLQNFSNDDQEVNANGPSISLVDPPTQQGYQELPKAPGFESLALTHPELQKDDIPTNRKQSKSTRAAHCKVKSSQSSSQTSSSMQQVAKESLQIGNILGLKVISNEQAAMGRITRSLKKTKQSSKAQS